ncbi:MAG: hypothetical protein AMS23_03815 [Bacteroides sp. SM1_62]|nr:MAG: hypothetical protein AMS26_05855 [Bacteroides sp. SM23_62]KPL25982.1 MAG: hypothetical protein AMS23_03815 [Bacteroides sp. SM1_62]
MKNHTLLYGISLSLLLFPSCLKDIDLEPISRTIDETFTVQNSIRKVQSFYRFYENTVLEVGTASPFSWDLAFESAGPDNRVLIGWASSSTVIKSGTSNFDEITQAMILDLIENSDDWTFDDPSYINTMDSVSLRNWENGEIYIQSRGVENDNYYAIQFVSKTDNSYTVKYASAQSLDIINEVTINRSTGFNYVYFSYAINGTLTVEPLQRDWDIMCSPYLGWWETSTPGEYAPYIQSGIMINNEYGVRIARVFDPGVTYEEIDISDTIDYEFTDMKGAIGSNWKILGSVGSENLYTMDPDKKYILKKYDYETDREMYFKLQIIDYKLNGEDHHPTIEFKYLGSN